MKHGILQQFFPFSDGCYPKNAVWSMIQIFRKNNQGKISILLLGEMTEYMKFKN